MNRERLLSRDGFEELLFEAGLHYQGIDGAYWFEDRMYVLSQTERTQFEAASRAVYSMLLSALEHVITAKRLTELGIPFELHEYIADSWRRGEPSIFSRLDFIEDENGTYKFLECNGDTPVTLLESGAVQDGWLLDCFPGKGHYNNLSSKLRDAMARYLPQSANTHFLSVGNAIEESDNIRYLRSLAQQAERSSTLLRHDELEFRVNDGSFVNSATGEQISSICKLYPWEWLLDEIHPHYDELFKVSFFEPSWKIPLCSKGILAILWELFPDSEHLVPAYLNNPRDLRAYVAKPLFGRRGDSLALIKDRNVVNDHQGAYNAQDRVFQQFIESASFDGWRCTLGAWIIDGEPVALGIRESREQLMRAESICVPHLVV